MFQDVTHADLLIVMAITLAIVVVGFGFMFWVARDISRMTRAVAGLVIQETAKLRRDQT
ncbi:MAG TPA: hypothetical protein VGD07_05345 [Methylomirabilota bacterium]|jgi:hypothetical protein